MEYVLPIFFWGLSVYGAYRLGKIVGWNICYETFKLTFKELKEKYDACNSPK